MKYTVLFEPYTKRHFIKSFAKKYHGAWEHTLKGLELEFSLIDLLLKKAIAECIHESEDGDIRICKTEFKIAGTTVSRHGSGNRCIVAIHTSTAVVHVLLVYCKNDFGAKNETAHWEKSIKENYPEYAKIL